MRPLAILLTALATSIGATVWIAPAAMAGPNMAAVHAVSSAQHQINIIITTLRRDFEQSSDVVNARSALRGATIGYRDITNSALESLRDTPAYRELNEQITTLDQKLTWGNYDDRMTPAQLVIVAQSLLDARRARTAMEAKVLAADSDVAKARDAMIDANGKLISLQREFNQSIASNPQFVQAKAQLEAAHAQASGKH